MKTKLVLTSVIAAMAATVALAANTTINIVNAGSDTGAFRQVLNLMSEQGLDSNFIQANNPVVASQSFGQENVLTVWSSEWPGNPELPSIEIGTDNLVALMVYETVMCSRDYTSFAEMSGETVQVATWGSDTMSRYIGKLSEQTGVNFEIVPYDGSGAMTQGYIGRDANTVLTITTRQAALEEDAGTTCFAISANGDLEYAFVDAIVSLNASEGTTQAMRDAATTMSETTAFLDAFKGMSLKVATSDNQDALIAEFETAVINFTPE